MGQMIPFCFSIGQKDVGPLFRLLKRSPAKDFHERGKFHDRIGKVPLYDRPPCRGPGRMLVDRIQHLVPTLDDGDDFVAVGAPGKGYEAMANLLNEAGMLVA